MFGNKFSHSGVLFFFLVNRLAAFDQTCNTCGQIDFNVEQGVQDGFLHDGRVLATKIVKSDSECFVECSLDCRCKSFSVCENLCQLSAGSRKLVKNSLRRKLGCRYYDFPPLESKCGSSSTPSRLCCLSSSPRCYNGATCIVNVTDIARRFQCLCPTGYYGSQCQITNPRTCLDYWTDQVKPLSGRYTIVNSTGTLYDVFCDFDSEEGLAWTLFESFDVDNMIHINGIAFRDDWPKNEHDLNWKLFRLPKSIMSEIANRSKLWRATCSHSLYGVDFRDYMRVRLSIVNPLTHDLRLSEEKCSNVDYINIKGTDCVNCTQMIFQKKNMLTLQPIRSRLEGKCNFDTSKVEHRCENGHYSRLLGRYDVCSDPKYRCSEKNTCTTEFWFGAVKANYGNKFDP